MDNNTPLDQAIQQARARMAKVVADRDEAEGHEEADDILVSLLKAYGCPQDILDAYHSLPKWYE